MYGIITACLHIPVIHTHIFTRIHATNVVVDSVKAHVSLTYYVRHIAFAERCTMNYLFIVLYVCRWPVHSFVFRHFRFSRMQFPRISCVLHGKCVYVCLRLFVCSNTSIESLTVRRAIAFRMRLDSSESRHRNNTICRMANVSLYPLKIRSALDAPASTKPRAPAHIMHWHILTNVRSRSGHLSTHHTHLNGGQ